MEVYNWLITAYSEPHNSLVESFYYDKRDKEFFSIHLADFLLLNDDFTLNERVNSSYPINIQKLIADRILREENKDADIVSIPRLDVESRKTIMQEFLLRISDTQLLAILQQRIINQDGSQRFDFYWGDEATDAIRDEWAAFKQMHVIPHIKQFLRDNDIDPRISRVWDIDGGDLSIEVNL